VSFGQSAKQRGVHTLKQAHSESSAQGQADDCIPLDGALSGRFLFILMAVLFRYLLELGYRDFVYPVYQYTGITLDIDDVKYVESWFLYLILLLIFPTKLSRASDYMMGYLLFVFLSPLLVLYALSNADRNHLYIILFSVVITLFVRSGRPFRLPYITAGRQIAMTFIYLGMFLVTVWMVARGGLAYFNLDFSRVYEFRSAVGDLVDQGLMAYLNTWATKVFGPIAFAVSLWRRQFFLAFLIFGLHILWFGISSHKAVLFYPLLVFFVWVGFRYFRSLFLIPFGISLVIMAAFYVYVELDEIMPGAILIHRVFFVPAKLTFIYYEFFEANPLVYWSESLTSFFLEYPYDTNTATVIGAYRGNPEEHANNSYLSTGYMHAGVFGMAVYGALVGLIMRGLDSLANNGIPVWLVVAGSIVPVQALLTSADLPTAVLTHGLGVAMLALFFIRMPPAR
jgi:hypothetical protein